jgi:hypothetical protein
MYLITESKFYLPLDDNGFIVNVSSKDHLSLRNKNYIESIINYFLMLHKNHVHSIYLSGSSANGRFREGYSDIDLLVVYSNELPFDKKLKGTISKEFCSNNPTLPQIDLSQRNLGNLFIRPMDFLIKTQMCCIYGNNLQDQISPFKVSEDIIYNLHLSRKLVDTFQRKILQENHPEVIKNLGTQVFKNIIRFSYETIMLEVKRYTRDIYTCYFELQKHYPDKQRIFYEMLNYSINGTTDKVTIVHLVSSIREWLIEKSETNVSL